MYVKASHCDDLLHFADDKERIDEVVWVLATEDILDLKVKVVEIIESKQ